MELEARINSRILFEQVIMVCFSFWSAEMIAIAIGRAAEHSTPLREVDEGDREGAHNHHHTHQRNARLLGEFRAGKQQQLGYHRPHRTSAACDP